MSDLNAPDINWGNMIGKNQSSNEMCNDFIDSDLSQINVLPSRGSNNNVLDIIMTNHPDMCSIPRYCDSFMQSDHYMLQLTIKCDMQTIK